MFPTGQQRLVGTRILKIEHSGALNTLYTNIVVERIHFALGVARQIGPVEHSGIKGAIREVLMADLFRPLLPADVGVATGILISVDDKQSAQQDIVVFDRGILPPVMFENGPAFIPIESALATIEVKSCLTAQELRNAHANALTIRELAIQNGSASQTESTVPCGILFALSSDLAGTGKTETQRYEEVLNGEPTPFSAICVVGKGSWFPQVEVLFDRDSQQYRTRNGKPFQLRWHEALGNTHHVEVLELLAALHSNIFTMRCGRGRPPLYHYLR